MELVYFLYLFASLFGALGCIYGVVIGAAFIILGVVMIKRNAVMIKRDKKSIARIIGFVFLIAVGAYVGTISLNFLVDLYNFCSTLISELWDKYH